MHAMTELAAGQEIGKYRIVRELGRGGMGVVYLATDLSLDRKVALKLLHPALSLTQDFAQRFKQEARAIAALSHPNIVDIHALEIIDGRLLIDVRYLEGGSLTDRFAAQVVTVPQLVRWSSEILSALAQCHNAGVIHRDVKPANILFDAHGRALLSDFGLAKAYSSHVESAISCASSSGFFLGSPRYAPLEAWSDSEPTPRWDVYSLGIVIYEAIAGAAPYSGASPLAILNQIMTNSIPRMGSVSSEVSPAFGELVDDMVHRDPKQRPLDGADALARLVKTPEYERSREIEEHTLIVPKPMTSVAPEGTPSAVSARKWRKFLVGAVAATTAVALIVFAALHGRQPNGERNGVPQKSAAVRAAAPVESSAAMPSPEALRKSRKVPESPLFAVYAVSFPEEAAGPAQSWYIAESDDATGALMYGVGPSFLSVFRIESSGDASFRLHGNWAKYLDSGSTVLRIGTAEGQGRWLKGHDVFTVSLHYTSDQDGAAENRVLSGARESAEQTDTQLALAIEEQPNALPLLYNELVSQKLAWAEEVDRLLPALRGSRALAPVIKVAQAESDDTLLESLRSASANQKDNIIHGWPEAKSPAIQVSCAAQGLFLRLDTACAAPEQASVEISVLRDYYLPVRDSPVWRLVLDPSAKPVLNFVIRDKADPVECAWKTRVTTSPGIVSADVFIPFESFGKDLPPESGDRWRINARVLHRNGETPSASEAFWGYPDFDDVTHGAVIILGPGLRSALEEG